MSLLASFVHDKKGIPVETVRSVLAGFKTKTVVFLADEKCEVDQGERFQEATNCYLSDLNRHRLTCFAILKIYTH